MVSNLGLLAREFLGLVRSRNAGRTIDTRHGAHDFCPVSRRCVDQVSNDRLGPGVRHGAWHYRVSVSGPDAGHIVPAVIALGAGTAKRLNALLDVFEGSRHVNSFRLL